MSPLYTKDGKLLLVDSKLAANENCCCCNVAGLTLTYQAGGGDGHWCDAALFMCLLSSPGGQETEVGIVNLNNGFTGGALVVVTLTITDEQANQITEDADDCCILLARLRCETPPNEDLGFGPGQCHPNLAGLTVTAKDNNGNNVIVFQGQSGEATISLNACPE